MTTIWTILKARYSVFEKDRITLMDLSREIGRDAKQFIHAVLHKGIAGSGRSLRAMQKKVERLLDFPHKNPHLYQVGALGEGLEEYVEAVFFNAYLTGHDVEPFLSEELPHEVIIGGIADASGEVVRHVRAHLDLSHAQMAYQYVSDLYEHFLDVEVTRNSKLRAKMGDVHRNMLQLEDIIFNLRLKQGS